jgi:hypothetical protein
MFDRLLDGTEEEWTRYAVAATIGYLRDVGGHFDEWREMGSGRRGLSWPASELTGRDMRALRTGELSAVHFVPYR